MQLLQAGGRYATDRVQRYELLLVALVALGIGAALLALRWPLFWAVIAAAVMGASRFGSRLTSIKKGILGERLVTDLLNRLPNHYFLVNDVVLSGTGGNADHVLLGPCGVLVIETKRIAGTIQCDGDYWLVKGRRRKSVSKQGSVDNRPEMGESMQKLAMALLVTALLPGCATRIGTQGWLDEQAGTVHFDWARCNPSSKCLVVVTENPTDPSAWLTETRTGYPTNIGLHMNMPADIAFTSRDACEAFRSAHPTYTKPHEECKPIHFRRVQ